MGSPSDVAPASCPNSYPCLHPSPSFSPMGVLLFCRRICSHAPPLPEIPFSPHVSSFSLPSQLKCHFLREPEAIYWPVALLFFPSPTPHSRIIHHFLLRTYRVCRYTTPKGCELHAETTFVFIPVHTASSRAEHRKWLCKICVQ